jgi:predicted transcriptional regulator of viral defense system
MATKKLRVRSGSVLALARKQHGVVSRTQLIQLGMEPGAIRHGLARGKLHRLMPGAYAVGRPVVEERGRWMAAVLACGPHAHLGHRSAAALLGLRRAAPKTIEVVVPADVVRRHSGIHVYRRAPTPAERSAASGGRHAGVLRPWVFDEIPVTAPAVTLRVGAGPEMPRGVQALAAGARRSAHGRAASSCAARRISVASSKGAPVSIVPTGTPSSVR